MRRLSRLTSAKACLLSVRVARTRTGGRHLLRGDGFAEVEALAATAAVLHQELELFARLDAFGHGVEAEALRHRQDRPANGRAVPIDADVPDERAVELQRVD